MRYNEIINESMSLMLVKQDLTDHIWKSVLPDEWTNEYDSYDCVIKRDICRISFFYCR